MRARTFLVAVTALLLLPCASALANSHTINGMYHGVHQDWDSKGRKYFHAWNQHGHGEKNVTLAKCNRDYTVYDCASDQRCYADGTVAHVHCTAYNGGTDLAYIAMADPSQYPRGNPDCGTEDDSYIAEPTYTDGHGVCDHEMWP